MLDRSLLDHFGFSGEARHWPALLKIRAYAHSPAGMTHFEAVEATLDLLGNDRRRFDICHVFGVSCARSALAVFEALEPGDARPRCAVEWSQNQITAPSDDPADAARLIAWADEAVNEADRPASRIAALAARFALFVPPFFPLRMVPASAAVISRLEVLAAIADDDIDRVPEIHVRQCEILNNCLRAAS